MARHITRNLRAFGASTIAAVALMAHAAAVGAADADAAAARAAAAARVAAPADDYDLGYRDGYHKLPSRDASGKNLRYTQGYKAGEARRTAQAPAGAGSDYDSGYRDGVYNLPQREADRRNPSYAAGYRAGEAHRRSGGIDSGGSAYDRGYRDGYLDKRSSKDLDNRAYAAGYSAGQAARTLTARPATRLPPARSVSELPGRPAAQLAADMTALGYRDIGQFRIKRETFSNWRGSSDNDCVRVIVKDGRVTAVTGLSETDCRR